MARYDTNLTPEKTTQESLICAECDETESLDTTWIDDYRESVAYFRKLGWVKAMPKDRDYIGHLCPGCAKELSKQGLLD